MSVKDILNADFVARRQKRWELVPASRFEQFRCDPTSIDRLMVKPRYMGAHRAAALKDINMKQACPQFACMQDLLDRHRGKLVVAGGCVYSALRPVPGHVNARRNHEDCDFFFHSVSEREANEILEDCVAFIASHAAAHRSCSEVIVDRQHHITNVTLTVEGASRYGRFGRRVPAKYVIYQFVHRVYPNAASVIGGFDIGPSMVLYDGDEIYGTMLGAWSVVNHAVIVDVARRSTTFGPRIVKYWRRGCAVIFPGLPPSPHSAAVTTALIERFFDMLKEADHEYNVGRRRRRWRAPEIGGELRYRIRPTGQLVGDFRVVGDNFLACADKRLVLSCDYGLYSPSALEFRNAAALAHGVLANVAIRVGMWGPANWPSEAQVRNAFRSSFDKFTIVYNCHGLMSRRRKHSTKDYERIFAEIQPTLELANSLLAGSTKWITQDPDRQWTSSINPVVSSARDYYGPKYQPFSVGIEPAVETALRLGSRSPRSPLSRLPRDLLDYVLFWVANDLLRFNTGGHKPVKAVAKSGRLPKKAAPRKPIAVAPESAFFRIKVRPKEASDDDDASTALKCSAKSASKVPGSVAVALSSDSSSEDKKPAAKSKEPAAKSKEPAVKSKAKTVKATVVTNASSARSSAPPPTSASTPKPVCSDSSSDETATWKTRSRIVVESASSARSSAPPPPSTTTTAKRPLLIGKPLSIDDDSSSEDEKPAAKSKARAVVKSASSARSSAPPPPSTTTTAKLLKKRLPIDDDSSSEEKQTAAKSKALSVRKDTTPSSSEDKKKKKKKNVDKKKKAKEVEAAATSVGTKRKREVKKGRL